MEVKNTNTNDKKRSPIERRKFLQMVGAALAGGSILAMTGALARTTRNEGKFYWQIDYNKCTFCGLCETHCVLPVSAVKCIHAKRICGYCDLCGGYLVSNARTRDTAAENTLCPTGAIVRTYIEDPYFEYDIIEEKCNGCGICAKGCNAFGNGSMYLQIKRELCKDCNECAIAVVCPADAIVRQPLSMPYNLKDAHMS
ncbi:MAG: 4Fe-4S binding protein [Dysgonamonadaceae bacterium]|jgi:electron transport complex protein RnfB|nr:4Fe-4S binding protein [Dysgonamonadaceae bacterium]